MGEAKRRAAAQTQQFEVGDADVVVVGRDINSPFSLADIADTSAMVCEIAIKGEMTRDLCREAADWTAKALDTQPGVMLILTVGGYDDDPREVLDIPEARQAFAWFGERLQELDHADGGPRLINRLDQTSQELMLVAMGYLKPARITYDLTKPERNARLTASAARVRDADARYRAEQAAKANQGGKQ